MNEKYIRKWMRTRSEAKSDREKRAQKKRKGGGTERDKYLECGDR